MAGNRRYGTDLSDAAWALVAPLLGHNPFSGQVFVFVGRRRNKVKCLLWDRTGFWCL